MRDRRVRRAQVSCSARVHRLACRGDCLICQYNVQLTGIIALSIIINYKLMDTLLVKNLTFYLDFKHIIEFSKHSCILATLPCRVLFICLKIMVKTVFINSLYEMNKT